MLNKTSATQLGINLFVYYPCWPKNIAISHISEEAKLLYAITFSKPLWTKLLERLRCKHFCQVVRVGHVEAGAMNVPRVIIMGRERFYMKLHWIK